MKKILCIDYGRKNLGFAFTESIIADPLSGIKISNQQDLVSAAISVISTLTPDIIIVGLPEGKLEEEIKSFAESLEAQSGIKTVLHPETLSTHYAVTKLRQSGASRRKLKNDHSYAAALILEDYLETQDSV